MNSTKNSIDAFGLTVEDHKDMNRVFRAFPEINSVILFGSRAKGTFKHGSDIDIALVYDEEDYHIRSAVKSTLEEATNIPYFFDVLDLKTISSEELKEHIKQFGVEIYRK